MADIYDHETGDAIIVGLDGANTSDAAVLEARIIAERLGKRVELRDDDGIWLVPSRGPCQWIAEADAENEEETI